MSSNILEGVVVPDRLVRDFLFTHDGTAVNLAFDTPNTFACMGLDLYIRNRGAAALTIAVNGQNAITVDAGDVYAFNDTKFWLVTVISAVIYDFQIFGVKITSLQKLGLMS